MDKTTGSAAQDTIYVVCGSVGDYSDRTEWMVAWYSSEADADAHREAASAEAIELAKKRQEAIEAEAPGCFEPEFVRTAIVAFRDDFFDRPAFYWVAKIERGKWPFDLPPRGEVN